MDPLRVRSISLRQAGSFRLGFQDDIGYALYVAQLGERSIKAKPLRGLGSQVMEIVAYDTSGTYRAVCTVSIGESIYVIHAFQKKSKAGSRRRSQRWTSSESGSDS